jgi:putative thioredoxin
MLGPVLEREAGVREGEVFLAKFDVDANHELAARYRVQGIPAVKAFRNGHVVDEFVGALPPQLVARFLDRLTGPSEAERLLEELRIEGEWPDVLALIDAGELEPALELLLERLADADENERERIRRLAVALFADLGAEHPLALRYRPRLATALY